MLTVVIQALGQWEEIVGGPQCELGSQMVYSMVSTAILLPTGCSYNNAETLLVRCVSEATLRTSPHSWSPDICMTVKLEL